MLRRWLSALLPCLFGLALWAGPDRRPRSAVRDEPLLLLPLLLLPWTYWPQQGPKWPEPVGQPYMRPPAYMAFPPFEGPYLAL